MTIRTPFAVFSAGALALSLALAAPADARPGQRGGPEQEQRFEKNMERLDRGVKERLAPKLGVDEATAAKLSDILTQAARDQRTARQRVHAERKKLKELVDKGASASALDTQLAALDAAMDAVPARNSVFDDTRRILTPEQQAKFVLAAPKIMRKMKHHRRHMRAQERGLD